MLLDHHQPLAAHPDPRRTGDFQQVLLGKDAPNLSPAVIARLRESWADDYARWQRRDLSARRYVYVWADGVYLQARMEPAAECMLVMIGATPEGKKELIGFQVGVRESAQSIGGAGARKLKHIGTRRSGIFRPTTPPSSKSARSLGISEFRYQSKGKRRRRICRPSCGTNCRRSARVARDSVLQSSGLSIRTRRAERESPAAGLC